MRIQCKAVLPKPSKIWKICADQASSGQADWRDKTTLKLVTEQLRASQKVLNKSDQFIPSVVA